MSTFTNLVHHVIFSTKHREPLLHPNFRDRVYAYIGGILRERDEILLGAGGVWDHVHLVIKIKPDDSVSDVLRVIRANSSKWLNELPDYPGHFAWQTGYAAFSVSKSQLPGVLNYAATQEEHHRYVSFQEEFRLFLDRHEIDYDERYLWD